MKKRKLLTLLLILSNALLYPLLAQSTYDLPNDDTACPGNCRQIPWKAGSDLWNGGALPNYTQVTCTGLAANGKTDDGPAIQACLNSAAAGTAVYIPAGTYLLNANLQMKSNVVLRGAKTSGPPYLPTADPTATTFTLGSKGEVTFGNYSTTNWGAQRAITAGFNKGSTVLTMAAGHGFVAGNWLMVSENPDSSIPVTANGDDGSCTWCGEVDGVHLMTQIVQVTAVNGNSVTINRPLYYTFQASLSPVARTFSNYITKAGLENIRFDGSPTDHQSPFIYMAGSSYCWVKGVETYDAGSAAKNSHIESEFAYGSEIRDNYFHFGRDSSSDHNYGIAFLFANSDHKVENNILRNHRHSTDMEGGGSGIVVLYNYIDDDYTDDTSYLGSARANHGAHPYMNLYEGNIYSHITADSYWGSSSHNVFFRNWLWGNETSPVAPNVPSPNWGFSSVDVWYNQNYYSFVGNVLGTTVGTPTNVASVKWTGYSLRTTSCSQSGSAIYDYGCNSVGQYSSTTNSSSINQGNYDYKSNGVGYWEGGSNQTLKSSMYYTSKPGFFGSCAWPAFGPDLSPVTGKLPAQARYLGDTSCGGATDPSKVPPPTNLSGTVVN